MTEEKRSLRKPFLTLSIVLGIFMGLLFIIFGLGILTGYIGNEQTIGPMYKMFGGVMFIYGIIRWFRVYFALKSQKEAS